MSTSFPRMHVSLYVKDIEATTRFYDQFFDQPATKTKEDYAKYILESPSLIISFVQNADRVAPGFGHLGFQLETEAQLEAHLARARALDMISLEERGTSCCYAVQDKYWVEDPDGHRWEVYYFHEDAEFNDPRYASPDAELCCMPPVRREDKVKKNLAQICCTPEEKAQTHCC